MGPLVSLPSAESNVAVVSAMRRPQTDHPFGRRTSGLAGDQVGDHIGGSVRVTTHSHVTSCARMAQISWRTTAAHQNTADTAVTARPVTAPLLLPLLCVEELSRI